MLRGWSSPLQLLAHLLSSSGTRDTRLRRRMMDTMPGRPADMAASISWRVKGA